MEIEDRREDIHSHRSHNKYTRTSKRKHKNLKGNKKGSSCASKKESEKVTNLIEINKILQEINRIVKENSKKLDKLNKNIMEIQEEIKKRS